MIEKTLNSRTVFDGRLLKIDVLDVEVASGQRTVREIVRHPGAAAVLCQLPDGRFVMVKQFRKAVELEMVEIVAGTLEPGEDPGDCAVREVREETGYIVADLTSLGKVYPAPGYTQECLHMYYATLEPEQGDIDPDEDEKIEVLYYDKECLEKMISTGEINDAKTLSAWMLFLKSQIIAK